jgi:hypothetical protein
MIKEITSTNALKLLVKQKRIIAIATVLIIFGVLLFLTASHSSNSVSDDFAGDYFTSGDFVTLSLSIKPDQTFTLFRRTDTNEFHEYSGTFSVSSDKIYLNPTNEFPLNTQDFVLVKWGKRRYLVFSDSVLEFCESINHVKQPWRSIFGIGFGYNHFFRASDKYKFAFGYPISPQGERICP